MGMWLVVRVPKDGFEAAPRCLPCFWACLVCCLGRFKVG